MTVLLGVCQVGKTMLARTVAAGQGELRVFDLERAAEREALSHTPELTLDDCSGLLVIEGAAAVVLVRGAAPLV